MKKAIIHGILLGISSLIVGSLFAIVPSAWMVFLGPQNTYRSENVVFNILFVLAFPLYQFFVHLIPYLLAGVMMSHQSKLLQVIEMKQLSTFIVAGIASVISVLLYLIVFSADQAEYGLIDYILTAAMEICYVTAFMFLVGKTRSTSHSL